ncbi:MAG: hypothetical protein NZT92_15205 [Abditibacteriales bacterium]|nr:hypothetical protein [Abditibacteriales bacterium]MDW8367327.1 hypothetical protein [Abditibacteriales bacterium]
MNLDPRVSGGKGVATLRKFFDMQDTTSAEAYDEMSRLTSVTYKDNVDG